MVKVKKYFTMENKKINKELNQELNQNLNRFQETDSIQTDKNDKELHRVNVALNILLLILILIFTLLMIYTLKYQIVH